MSVETPLPLWRVWLWPAVVGIAIAVANILVFILLPPDLVERLGALGYMGAFLSAGIANASIVVPVPYYPLLIRLGQAFNPYGVALAAAAGSVLGELVAFYAGRSGRKAMERTSFYEWVHRQMQHPWRAPLVLFLLSAPPNPFFDVAGIIAGAVGIPVWVFAISVFLARIVRMGLVVVLGYTLFGGW